MKAYKTILGGLLMFIACTTAAQQRGTVAPNATFYLEYKAPTKTVVISGYAITLTEIVEEYDNPASATPSKRTEVVKRATLTKGQMDSLSVFSKKCGFYALPKNEYGAAANDRFYPYTIFVKNPGAQKRVLYRSNPSADSAPKPFSEMEKKVNELVSTINTWK